MPATLAAHGCTPSTHLLPSHIPPQFTQTYGGKGGSPGQFRFPTGVAYHAASGAVFVADGDNNRIQKLLLQPDGSLAVVKTAGSLGPGARGCCARRALWLRLQLLEGGGGRATHAQLVHFTPCPLHCWWRRRRRCCRACSAGLPRGLGGVPRPQQAVRRRQVSLLGAAARLRCARSALAGLGYLCFGSSPRPAPSHPTPPHPATYPVPPADGPPSARLPRRGLPFSGAALRA